MNEHLPLDKIRQVAEELTKAKRVLFITGAGLSADSGMPTYRGVGGLYGDMPVRDGLTIEDLLSGYMMRTQPTVVWEYLGQLAGAFQAAHPNVGHEVMAHLEKRLEQVWILTQNVDGLHGRAGSKQVIDIHGDIHHLYCTKCHDRQHITDLASLPIPPYCKPCHKIMRPDVVLFGEMLPFDKVEKLQSLCYRGIDMVFSVGTSSLFPYISEPVRVLGHRGATTVEINPGETDVSDFVDIKIQTRAAPALQAIYAAMDS